jgi:hypothetical protein
MQTGEFPKVVEHKNGDVADNRWNNLQRPQDNPNSRNKLQKPSASYLRECFAYEPTIGILTWKCRPLHHFKNDKAQRGWNTRWAGKPAGLPNRDGHIRLLVNTGQFTAHRLIWVMQTGEWPTGAIDHKNGNPADNRWENLRETTDQQNQWNRRHTGKLPRGVVRSQRDPNRFVARASVGERKLVYIGTYDTAQEAHAAWRAFVDKERGEFFRAD